MKRMRSTSSLNTPDGKAGDAAVVADGAIITVEVQAVCVGTIECNTPVVAVATYAVPISTAAVARSWQK